MTLDTNSLYHFVDVFLNKLLDYSPKLIAAFAILFIGLYAIKIINKVAKKIMIQRELEPTLSKFLTDLMIWALKILLFVMFISKLGIETSSFVAILGAAGLAIGLSLQGSLSNFAGGVLIILFKPFKVGNTIEFQSVTGTVTEIQIFVTKVITANNQTIFIPNGILSNGIITNFSIEEVRRADLNIVISFESDIKIARAIIVKELDSNIRILKKPCPNVEIVLLTETGFKISIKVWTKNEDFSQVCSEILENCKTNLLIAGIKS